MSNHRSKVASALRLIVWSSKTGLKTSSVASAVWQVVLSCWIQMFSISYSSIFVSGFSVPQTRQFCLFTYPPRSKWASSENMIFLPKSASSVSRSQAHFPALFKRIPYSLGERIKLIICQIRHKQSVTIHEISTSWKKR